MRNLKVVLQDLRQGDLFCLEVIRALPNGSVVATITHNSRIIATIKKSSAGDTDLATNYNLID